jgi:hypothetical protein
MKSKYLAAALLGTALLTGAAFAQNATDRSSANPAVHRDGQWRASKLIGVNVYNENNEKIGDIEELIVDKSSKVENVVLGVGGFLGMGEHEGASGGFASMRLTTSLAAVRASNSVAAVPVPTVSPSMMTRQRKPVGGEALTMIVGVAMARHNVRGPYCVPSK